MICPRCREENNEDNTICVKCGLKLKITCPKCKNLNPVGRKFCSGCNLKLISFCPECRAANIPTAKECRKCKRELPDEKKQPEIKIQQAAAVKTSSLQNYAVISAELINISAIKAKIRNDEIVNKLLTQFYNIVALEAKKNGEGAKKLNEQVMAVEFKNVASGQESAINAVTSAQKILDEINELNFNIQNKLNINLKVKIGISVVNIQNRNYFSQVERSIATNNSIIASPNVYNSVSGRFEFEIVGPIPINEKMLTFYKLKKNSAEKTQIKPEIAEESLKKNQKQIREAASGKTEAISSEKEAESRNNVYNFLFDLLTKSEEGFISGISGADGIGKSTLLHSLRQSLAEEKIIWLVGQCQPFNNIAPFALMQDILKNLISLPIFITDLEAAKKNISDFLENSLATKDKKIENILNRLLLQESNSSNVDLFANQEEVQESIFSVLNGICAKAKVVLLIEDFELVDKASLDCLRYFANNGLLNQKIQIIITHLPDINIKNQFHSPYLEQKVFDLNLKPMTDDEMNSVLLNMLNNQDIIPKRLKNIIFKNAKGLPIYIEQVLWTLLQANAIYVEDNLMKFNPNDSELTIPASLKDVIKIRLSQFNNSSAEAAEIIVLAGILGIKFMPGLIYPVLENTDEQKFNHLIQSIVSGGIFVGFDNYSVIFKHRLIREVVYQDGLFPEERQTRHGQILKELKKCAAVNGAAMALHAELANLPDEAVNFWNQAAKEAVEVGDNYSYTISQQRILNLIEKIEIADESYKEDLKLNIYEKLGKINYKVYPEEAIKYLSGAIIEREKRHESVEVIDLAGYLSKSCELTGNYSGVVECADKALAKISKEQMPLEYALLSYSRLESVYNLGRLEEAVISAKNDIIPVIREALSKSKTITILNQEELNYAVIDSELILAKSLAAQGNKECLNLANSISLKANELNLIDIEAQAKLVNAFFRTLQGEINSANAVLEYLKGLIPKVKDENKIKLYWGFVNLLSSLLTGNYKAAENIIYSVLALAEECGEYSFQAIIKLFIGKLYKESGNMEQAKMVYQELINYCTEYKLATGALLCWYLMAETHFVETETEKAKSIAEKTLEITEKPGINNCLISIMTRRLLAEINIVTGNFDSAYMYLDQALTLAKNMDLYLFQAELHLSFGKIYHEMAAVLDKEKAENAKNAHKFYIESLDIAQRLENEHLISQVEKELTNLSTFCQLSGIKI